MMLGYRAARTARYRVEITSASRRAVCGSVPGYLGGAPNQRGTAFAACMLMRLTFSLILLSCLGTLVSACGSGGDLDPGAGDDPGSGSLTLLVDAEISARPLLANASKQQDFITEFRVRIDKAGTPLTIGSVVVESAAGAVVLTYGGDDNRWNGAQAGYSEVYRLSVMSAGDVVDNVQVDGPSLHWFTAPILGATVNTQLPVTVAWSRDGSAESAQLDTDKLDGLTISDTGSFEIPVGGFKSKRDGVEQEYIRLTRSSRITPSGALVGSQMQVEIRNQIEVLVAPSP
jgi:hypothetical protein